MSAADIDRVVRTGKPMRDVVLRSPVTGVVMAKNAVAGARVMPSDTLYEIADLRTSGCSPTSTNRNCRHVRIGTTAQVIVGGATLAGPRDVHRSGRRRADANGNRSHRAR